MSEKPKVKATAKYLPGREPKPETFEPLAEAVQRIAVLHDGALIGQVTHKTGDVLAEMRLARGVTVEQLCSAIRHGKAGPAAESE